MSIWTPEPGDQTVLEALWPVVAPRRKRVPSLDVLTQRVCDYVERAVEAEDVLALADLYAALLPLEQPLSAPLACTLRLVDWAGTVLGPESAAPPDEPGLVVPQWRRLFPPDGLVPRSTLTRHALILGETGSGKTRSAVLPVLGALVRAPVTEVAATLVVDPKRELLPELEALAPERVRLVDPRRLALNVVAGPRWSLTEDFAAGRWLTAAHRVLVRTASFVPTSAARVLLPQGPTSDANSEFFDREGAALAQCALAVVLLLLVRAPHQISPRLMHAPHLQSWVDALRARAAAGESALALTSWVLVSWVRLAPDAATWQFSELVQALVPARHDAAALDEEQELRSRVLEYWDGMRKIDRQFAGVLAAAVNAVIDFARPGPARSLYVGCEPGYLQSSDRLDLAPLVSPRTADGTVLVVQPARDDADHLVTVALKASMFEAVLDDPDRIGGGPDLPLVAYVCDEFHRFVTCDPVHGEQSYLDTCRAAGGCCVLATQSVASVEHALVTRGVSAGVPAALDIIWTNTAAKLIFRSTHSDTGLRVQELCPGPGGAQSVVCARPLSGLPTGSCYAALPDGRFERCRLEPFVAPEAVRALDRYPAFCAPEGDSRAPRTCEASPDAVSARDREQGDE